MRIYKLNKNTFKYKESMRKLKKLDEKIIKAKKLVVEERNKLNEKKKGGLKE